MAPDALQTTLALVARSAEGSEPAFSALHARCVDGVRQSAMLRLGGRGHAHREEVEDVLQEVFAEAFAAIRAGTFDAARTEGGFRNFLATLTHSRVVDHIRRQQAVKRGGGQTPRHISSSMASALADPRAAGRPGADPDRAEEGRRVLEALLELKEDYRRALDLRYFCEMTYEEVASQLGYERVEPVRLLMHRARIALGKRLGVDEWRR